MHFFSLAVFCFSCLLVVPGLMHAQDPCPGILRNGVWEYQSSQGSDNQTSSFLSWFCSKDFKSSKEASESGGALGIPIGDIPVSLSGYTRDTQWSEYRNEACSTSSAKYNHLSDFSNFTSKASTAVVSAWLGCVNREGVKAYLTTSSDLKAFTITIQRTTSLGKPEFTLSQIAVTSGKLVCSPTLNDQVLFDLTKVSPRGVARPCLYESERDQKSTSTCSLRMSFHRWSRSYCPASDSIRGLTDGSSGTAVLAFFAKVSKALAWRVWWVRSRR
jgi:hypothetical protein